MEKRKLGGSGLEVAPLCLGGNVFGWTIDEAKSFEVLDAFVDAGLDFIDTADVYSRWAHGNQGGESETIIGKWLQRSGKRDRVVIATKVGMEMGPDKKGLRKDYILRAAEDSLRRLQTDVIDLYQSHRDDPETPLDETLAAYAQLIQQGKVRAIGASNYSGERLLESLRISREQGLPRYEALQPEYNLYERAEYEKDLEPVCRDNNIGVISYFSLASGFLSGKYRSEDDLNKSQRGPGVKRFLNERGFRILKALDEVTERQGAAQSSVALAWLIARPSITAPIASATSREQMDGLVKATQLTLSSADIETLDQASAP